MVYYSDITDLQSYVRFVAKKHRDEEGIFWRLYGVYEVERSSNDKLVPRIIVMVCDTYEELAIWCDLQNIKIHHKEIGNECQS